MLVTSIFSFFHHVIKSLLSQGRLKLGTCSKELNVSELVVVVETAEKSWDKRTMMVLYRSPEYYAVKVNNEDKYQMLLSQGRLKLGTCSKELNVSELVVVVETAEKSWDKRTMMVLYRSPEYYAVKVNNEDKYQMLLSQGRLKLGTCSKELNVSELVVVVEMAEKSWDKRTMMVLYRSPEYYAVKVNNEDKYQMQKFNVK